MRTKVFISYSTAGDNIKEAIQLERNLKSKNYEVFLDKSKLRGADAWKKMIYDNIADSDVLLVLLTEGVLESVWVQREVDYARGVRVVVLPLLVRKFDKLDEVLKKLELGETQYFSLLTGTDDELEELDKNISALADTTRAQQRSLLSALNKKWEAFDEEEESSARNPNYAVYEYEYVDKKWHRCKLHLAVGDITKMEGIDVLVNSENTHMQMARFFDRKSVSGTIRLAGARKMGEDILEDTVKEALEKELIEWFKKFRPGTPIPVTTVLVTSAGHETSELIADQKMRYIFHVASVKINGRKMESLNDAGQIKECIINCLKEIKFVNDKIKVQNPQLPPIKSIIFPILGTGAGGMSIVHASEAILSGLTEWLKKNPTTTIESIYLTAYRPKDAELVKAVFTKHGKLSEVKS